MYILYNSLSKVILTKLAWYVYNNIHATNFEIIFCYFDCYYKKKTNNLNKARGHKFYNSSLYNASP